MARNHHLTIPVYSAAGANQIIRRVTFRQAKEMIEKGEVFVLKSPRKNGKGGEVSALQLKTIQREERNSPATITFGEMRANAGEFSPNSRWVRDAQSKIEVWPEIGDDRAVRVGIRT